MCGIWAIFGYDHNVYMEMHHALTIAHRGPDFFRIETIPHFQKTFVAFHRLSIMDDLTGQQPLRIYDYPHLHLMYNGEIYNYKELNKKYEFKSTTNMDGEVILHMVNKFGIERTLDELDGVFARCVIDTKSNQVHLGRDTFGVRPLFRIGDESGSLGISSEAKGLVGIAAAGEKVTQFPIGSYATYEMDRQTGKAKPLKEGKFTEVTAKPGFDLQVELTTDDVKENIRRLFTDAIKKRLMSERRIGCMLSGGLDSSLVAALVVKLAREEGVSYPIQTFSIGMPGSTDLANARLVADKLGTDHHEINFTPDEGCRAVEKVIHSLESYDITTIRASVGMYLISKYIKENTDSVVVFSGEGSDELTQGYIYFHNAPDADQAHEESKRLLRDLYLYDNLRADRTTAAHGLELRVPFLDKAFCHYYLTLDKHMVQPTNGIEKYLLRSAFDGHLTSLLPDKVLWRAKEAFSDGVSSLTEPWYAILQRYAGKRIADIELDTAEEDYPDNPPTTKESLYYRKIFEKSFKGQTQLTPYMWLPKWVGGATDPSARTLKHYKQETS